MTDTNTVNQISAAQKQLDDLNDRLFHASRNISNHISDLAQLTAVLPEIAKDLTAVNNKLVALSKEIAWDDATTTTVTPSGPAAAEFQKLIDRFKSGLGPAPAVRPSAAPLTTSIAPQPVQKVSQAAPAINSVAGSYTSSKTLTDQARELLRAGNSYFNTIETLVKRHPAMARENIRRAVGRANGGAR